jgi:hypothetical protein
MRQEVKDYMRMCEWLLSVALQSGELSKEECDAIASCSKERQEKTLSPLQSKVQRNLQARLISLSR